MAFLLEELGSKIGKGITDGVVDDVNSGMNSALLKGVEKIPVIGDGVKGLVKGFNIAKEEGSSILDHLEGKKHITPEEKEGLLDRFDKDRLHNKLHDDLNYSDDPKLSDNQKIVYKRKAGDLTSLKKKLFNKTADINDDFVNPDGSLNLESLSETEQTLLKDRINQPTRHAFDLDESRSDFPNPSNRLLRNPRHSGMDFSKFTEGERNSLLGSGEKIVSDVKDIPLTDTGEIDLDKIKNPISGSFDDMELKDLSDKEFKSLSDMVFENGDPEYSKMMKEVKDFLKIKRILI